MTFLGCRTWHPVCLVSTLSTSFTLSESWFSLYNSCQILHLIMRYMVLMESGELVSMKNKILPICIKEWYGYSVGDFKRGAFELKGYKKVSLKKCFKVVNQATVIVETPKISIPLLAKLASTLNQPNTETHEDLHLLSLYQRTFRFFWNSKLLACHLQLFCHFCTSFNHH